MKEEFVTYEIAKKLEAKGMGNDGNYGYNDKGEICVPVYNLDDDQVKAMCPCPQIHEVLKWLRDEKKIYVVPTPYPSMSTIDKVIWSCLIKHKSDGAFMEVPFMPETYMHYKDAALEGIEYVIDKLI